MVICPNAHDHLHIQTSDVTHNDWAACAQTVRYYLLDSTSECMNSHIAILRIFLVFFDFFYSSLHSIFS